MIVTVEIPAEVESMVARHLVAAEQAHEAIAKGLLQFVDAGADSIREGLVTGQTALTMQRPNEGMAGQVHGWMIDESIPLAALGFPSNTPAAKYAAILNFGGTIRPVHAKALAVPISPEAKQVSSPRDMPGLVLAKRAGKPPLLIQPMGEGLNPIVHWVLVASVTIPAFGWFDQLLPQAIEVGTAGFESVLDEYVTSWSSN